MGKPVRYIETGIMSCPLLPENWEIKRLKYVAKVQTGRTPSIQGAKVDYFENGEINWFTPADFNNERFLDDSTRKVNQLALENGEIQLFPNYSIYLVSIGATLGKIGISEKSGSANQQINVISFYNSINPVFGFYYLKSISNNLISEVDFTTLPILNQSKTKDLFIPIPALEEQKIISAFLDVKTAEIDILISQKRKLIECLKEERIEIINQAVIGNLSNSSEKKPSGFEWVPTIPKDWTTNKIKNVAKIFGRIGYRGYQTSDLVNEGEGAITLSPSNMKEFEMDFAKCTYLSWFKYNESPEIQIDNGDILFVKTGSTYGKTSLVKNLPEKATINPQLLVFKEVKINTEFFYYVLLSQLIQAQVSISVIGGTIPTISQEKIGNYYLFVPPIKEQDYIVALINKHLEQTNHAINKIEQEIDLINEYRAALINEVVTGKITLN